MVVLTRIAKLQKTITVIIVIKVKSPRNDAKFGNE